MLNLSDGVSVFRSNTHAALLDGSWMLLLAEEIGQSLAIHSDWLILSGNSLLPSMLLTSNYGAHTYF